MKFRISAFYLLALGLLMALALPARAEFELTDTEGKTHTLSRYKGKWLLVNFWATWCPPCLEEIPDLISLHDNPKNNVSVIGVAMDFRSVKQVTDFADGMMMTYPIVAGNRKLASQIGPVDGLPTSYLFNPQGKLVAHQSGLITADGVMNFIRSTSKGARK